MHRDSAEEGVTDREARVREGLREVLADWADAIALLKLRQDDEKSKVDNEPKRTGSHH